MTDVLELASQALQDAEYRRRVAVVADTIERELWRPFGFVAMATGVGYALRLLCDRHPEGTEEQDGQIDP